MRNYAIFGLILFFIVHTVHAKVVFLHGTACAGKTSLCHAMIKQSNKWKYISEDDIYFEKVALRWAQEFPHEFSVIQTAIDSRNIFHALMCNQILFQPHASNEERIKAEEAIKRIQIIFNTQPINENNYQSWNNALREYITQTIIDTAADYHVIVDTVFLKEESLENISQQHDIIHIIAYCPFLDMIKRVMRRNYQAFMNGEDISNIRFFHQALYSFLKLYDFSDNPEGAIDILYKKDVIHGLDLVRLCLQNSLEATGATLRFTRGEISINEFEEYRRKILSYFTSDKVYIIPRIPVDRVIRTDHTTSVDAARFILNTIY